MSALEGSAIISRNGKKHVLNVLDAEGPRQLNCKRYFKKKLASKKGYKREVRGIEKSRFFIAAKKAKYGHGQGNWHLSPLRTIAVDPTKIPLGSLVYIPALKGLKGVLPGGAKIVHDGYVFAGDTGSGIKGNHIDIFQGLRDKNPFPGVFKSTSKKTFRAYIVQNSKATSAMRVLHHVK